ncbi:DUF4011 domain-containing anti-phage protein Hhe [Spartinivicinus poritis]|uniref:DUF4011 domain-containing protein n=1 Tax=Spartinivicinus poritis TaxID=2994640 RepID=A0ABT5UEU2_9GAMM|nr:DUF4011 domain-containing anti-phage protein Hhe [Spartinivicinus sp. A2-2]MDE1464900.1 DUF4011 domain-containing protein [Spartinivicinus sp. A2-2]
MDNSFAFESLESVRKKLLDLSSRNSLINYRHSKSNSVRLIDELPDQIYSVLQQGDHSLTFIPVPEPSETELIQAGYIVIDRQSGEKVKNEYPTEDVWAKRLGLDTGYDLPPADAKLQGAAKHQDHQLQTLLYASSLEARLRSIRNKSETAIEESGANVLYLALGFLQWYESPVSDVARLAPLFTLPVRLKRDKLDKMLGVYRYSIDLKDDGLFTNITLSEKLANDFGMILPEVNEDINPEEYFDTIQQTILCAKPRWKVCRYASLVLLDFAKQTMYQDLDPQNWPENHSIQNHNLIRRFFHSVADEEEVGISSYVNEYSIDDIENVHSHFPLIYDADSSQHSALIDAVEGKNLVIEGPPGSGKSQTITNLIAACIANGQKVLFVAEKMAALDVVKGRLDKAGLGDFCLELHSHKTNKRKILDDLIQRINRLGEYPKPGKLNDSIARYEDLKSKLNYYVSQINNKWKQTGLTIHQILNKATRYREQYGIQPDTLEIEGVSGQTLTSVKQQALLDDADMLADIFNQVAEQAEGGKIYNHYWYGVDNTELLGFQAKELCQALKHWNGSLQCLNHHWQRQVIQLQLTIDPNTLLETIESIIDALALLPNIQGEELLGDLVEIAQQGEAFKQMLDGYQWIHAENDSLSTIIKPEFISDSNTVKKLDKVLTEFRGLGIRYEETLDALGQDKLSLLKSEELANSINIQLERIKEKIPRELHPVFVFTYPGLQELSKLSKLLNALPPELWRYRHVLFDNPDLDVLLKELKHYLQKLLPLHEQLQSYFKLDNLPQSGQLKSYQMALDNAGFFCFCSSQWRQARQAILALVLQPKQGKKQAFNLLTELIEYTEGVEYINRLHQQDPLLGEWFQGVETPIERIMVLRSWYQAVREEYGIGFGDRVAIGEALFTLDRQLVQSIIYALNGELGVQVEQLVKITEILQQRYPTFSPLLHRKTSPTGPVELLRGLHKKLDQCLGQLTFASHHQITVGDLQCRLQQLTGLQTRIEAWRLNPAVQYFTQEKLPLSIMPGSASERLLTIGRNSLAIAEVVINIPALVNAISAEPTVARYQALQNSYAELSELTTQARQAAEQFINQGKVNKDEWFESSQGAIQSLIESNQKALAKANWLDTWLDYIRVKQKLCATGLRTIVEGVENSYLLTKDLQAIVQLVMYHQLAKEILTEHKELAEFSGMEQMAIRRKYQEYDKKLLGLQRQKIAYQVDQVTPPVGVAAGRVANYTEMALIRHEATKKARHIAVRHLLQRSGKAILELKPCFMMSPMSVAQYLVPGKFEFDLVVMDEASQIRPEEALGAIARGSRLVVVGDPKQLPPTSFFSKIASDVQNDEESVALEDSESILESVIPMFTTRRLRWHYRSQHESLIAFSNQHFYDSNLVLFPSPFNNSDKYGINFMRVNGCFYQRRNREEAQEIVKAVSNQLITRPQETVGIVAMNSSQQDEIELQLDKVIKEDPDFQHVYEENRFSGEPLFIKNLENVQGDERDVIIISMTYGPEQPGGRTMQRFGPINSNVGWRRLNVLFTRAKKRMYIFSSMDSSDVLVSGKSSRGVQSLRAFLEYCETGHLHQSQYTGKSADSDFEIAVMQALASHGYQCEPQLGVAGYYLDLAVYDPGQPGRFLMAIECDGATYHSAKSARDRDCLRQEILEGLGWKIRRIWSTDWFKNPAAQLQPIIQELERLKTTTSNPVQEIQTTFG